MNKHQSNKNSSSIIEFSHLNWKQIEELPRESTIFFLPISPMEEHGPHLPVGTDFLTARDTAKDAIIALEALAPEANTPAVWNALADQYSAVGLFDQAAGTYATALVLAESTRDRLSQAQAELGCAQAYQGLNDPATALLHVQEALGLFQSLGDSINH